MATTPARKPVPPAILQDSENFKTCVYELIFLTGPSGLVNPEKVKLYRFLSKWNIDDPKKIDAESFDPGRGLKVLTAISPKLFVPNWQRRPLVSSKVKIIFRVACKEGELRCLVLAAAVQTKKGDYTGEWLEQGDRLLSRLKSTKALLPYALTTLVSPTKEELRAIAKKAASGAGE